MTKLGAIQSVLLTVLLATAIGRPAPTQAEEAGDQMLAVNPQTLRFATPAGLPSCVKTAALRGDPTKGPSVLLFKASAGCRIPWHWHTPSEQVMVASGTGVFEMKDAKPLRFGAGAYVAVPGHHVHHATCTTACTMFTVADGVFDIHYVDATGKEIPAEEALKVAKVPGKAKKR